MSIWRVWGRGGGFEGMPQLIKVICVRDDPIHKHKSRPLMTTASYQMNDYLYTEKSSIERTILQRYPQICVPHIPVYNAIRM